MDDEFYEISKFYIPGRNLQLKFIKTTLKSISESLQNIYAENQETEQEIPFGIIDFAKKNNNYKDVIRDFGIMDHPNNEIYENYKSKYRNKSKTLMNDNTND